LSDVPVDADERPAGYGGCRAEFERLAGRQKLKAKGASELRAVQIGGAKVTWRGGSR
jgi:hypothetical protein